MDISYVVNGVRLSSLYSFTFRILLLRIKDFPFLNLILKRERPYLPRFCGSSQDISALLDVMLAKVRLVGRSCVKPTGKSKK